MTPRIHVECVQDQVFPAVGVLYRNLRPSCTVTLIDECVVITAAHCFEGGLPAYRTVSFNGTRHFFIESVDIPDEFVMGGWTYDIALVTLSDLPDIKPMAVSRERIGIRDWDKDITLVGRSGGILEWSDSWIIGRLEETSLIMWADPLHFLIRGDSGGPLLMNDKVVGINIISIWDGTNPDCTWYMGLSTDVGEYIDWIDEQLKPNSGGLPELPVPGMDGSAPPPRTRPNPVRHRHAAPTRVEAVN